MPNARPGPHRLAIHGRDHADERAASRIAAGHDRLPELDVSGAPAGQGADPLRRALGEPGQPLPPRSRSYFEARLGRDFGAVRIHTSTTAAATASAFGAAAYAAGADIAFAPGRYAPESPAGRRLLAHELAHVTQQAGGSAAVAGAAAPAGIQASLETIGGSWEAEHYGLQTGAIGAALRRLAFTPNDRVQATCIALVQSVRSVVGGKPAFGDEATPAGKTRKARSDATGLHVDSPEESVSPLYHMDSPDNPAAGLAGGKPRGNSGTGYRIGLPGLSLSEPAWLSDFPTIPLPVAPASQTFETAALAVAGPQEGTYYGSVTWGWQLPASAAAITRGKDEKAPAFQKRQMDAMALLPLAVGQVGAPSQGFLSASTAWNAGKSSGGEPTQDLPLALPAASANIERVPAKMNHTQIAFRLAEIARVLRDVPAANKARAALGQAPFSTDSLLFEQAALEAEQRERRAKATAQAPR